MSILTHLRLLLARPGSARRPSITRTRTRLYFEELEARRLLSAFYISPAGNDSNLGTSLSTPWKTINRANQATFHAGDRILFQGGVTFSGNLALGKQDAGTPASPITIGSYGTGPATISAGTGTGISISNTLGISINNLAIIGSGYATNSGNGVYVLGNQPGATLVGFDLDHVDVSGFGHAGIHIVASDGLITEVSITNTVTHDNGDGGLDVLARGNHASNIYIARVQAYHNAGEASALESGFGMFLLGVTNAVIKRSVVHDNGWLPGNGGETGGIEVLQCNRVLIQYNESYANHAGAADGDGIILDSTNHSIMQFNYAHDNDGAGLFLGAEAGFSSSDNVVRYNVSQNNARTHSSTYGGIFIWQNVSAADIYNNTVFMAPSTTGTPAAIWFLGFSGTSVHVRNNIFITTGGMPLVAYNGGGSDLLFQGNDYWSRGSTWQILWITSTFTALDGTSGWRSGTGQEIRNSSSTGYQVDPQLMNPGAGETLGNPDLFNSLYAYQLSSSSALRQAGLDLSQFGLTWDPYRFAADAFFGQSFNSTPRDFFSSILPASGSNLFSVGAEQITAMPGNLTQIAGLFTQSFEYDANQVKNAYADYLGRPGSLEEVDAWVQEMQAGLTVEQMQAGFLGSAEYQQRAGGTTQAWVQSLYLKVLGRSPSAEEVNYWLQTITDGKTPLEVAYSFVTSSERESIDIKADYLRYLGRQGSAAEIAAWLSAFGQGLDNQQIVAQFLASAEYYYGTSKGHGDDAAWIDSLYQDILTRSPSDVEVIGWYSTLAR